MRNTNAIIIDRLKAEIDSPGLNRNVIAGKAGMNYSTLGRKLEGQTPFTLTEADQLAAALNISVLDLMTEKQENKS